MTVTTETALLRVYDEVIDDILPDGYPRAWSLGEPAIKHLVRDQAGHRCVRCGHPYRAGEHGNGEWSPCDTRCNHYGPFRHHTTDDGRRFYARYRWGTLTWGFGKTVGDAIDASIQAPGIVVDESGWDGVMSTDAMFLPGRLRFIKHGHDRIEPNQRPPFGCCLLIWESTSNRRSSESKLPLSPTCGDA